MAAAGIGAFSFLALSVRALTIRAPLWFDGPVLGIQEAIGAGRLYQPAALSSPPYVVTTHTPLSYWLGFPLYQAGFGPPGLRLLNALLILACAAVVYFITRGIVAERQRLCGFFAACAFLLFPPVYHWSLLMRSPDALSCLFDLLTVLILLRMKAGGRRELLAGFLFFLAVISKQSCIYTFGPVLLISTLQAPRRLVVGAQRLISFAVPLVVFTLYMQGHTNSGFLTNVLYANLVEGNAVTWATDVLFELFGFWIFAALVLRFCRAKPPLIATWFYVSAAAGLLTDWKDGANSVYFFEASAALAMIAGQTLHSILNRRRTTVWVSCAALAAAIVLILGQSDTTAWQMVHPENVHAYDELADYLRSKRVAGRSLFSQDASLSLAVGEEPVWNDALVLSALRKQNRWDDSFPALQLRTQKYYAVVILVNRFTTPALRDELANHYYRAAVFGGMHAPLVYLPMRSSHGPSRSLPLPVSEER